MTKGMQEQKKNEDGVYLFTSVHVRCNTESCFHHRGTKKREQLFWDKVGVMSDRKRIKKKPDENKRRVKMLFLTAVKRPQKKTS